MSALGRSPILWRKGARDLRAAPAQAAALVVIAMLGVSSLVALVGAYRDLGSSYNQAYAQLHFADATFALADAPEQALAVVGHIDGVQAVTGRLIIDSGLAVPGADGGSGPMVRARLIGIPADRQPAVNAVLVQQGRYFSPTDGNAVLLESHFAKAYGLAPGARVSPVLAGAPVDLTAVGVAASPEYLVVSASRQDVIPSARSFAVLFVPLAELQRASAQSGQINDVAVRLRPGADRARTVAAIQQALAPYHLLATTLQADQPSNAALHLDLDGYREIALLMPGLILLVSAASLYVMLGRQIRAQQAQIGLMKALGYGSRTIEAHYLGSALAVTLLGALLGIGAGFPLGRLLTSAYAQELGIPLVQTRVFPDVLGLGLALSLFAALLGAWGPTRQVARLAPAAAMRPSPSALLDGHASPVERLVRLPLWARLAVRNVARVPRRTLTTGAGIVFACTLILMGWSLGDSMGSLVDRHFHTVERWDEVAVFSAPQPDATLQRVRAIDGVQRVEPFIQQPAAVTAGSRTQEIQLTAISPDETLHALQLPRGTSAPQALAPGRIVLTSELARTLHVGVGDTVGVEGQTGTRQVRISALTDEMMSAVAYVPLADAQAWLGQPGGGFNGLYLTTSPASAAQVQAALYRLGAGSVQAKAAVERDWQSLFGLFYAFMGAILAFAVVMAFALLFTTMTANVLERERELATMRAVGTDRGTIALLLSAESLVLWLLATLPGLLLGTWVASRMGDAFQSDLFAFRVAINPGTYVVTALGILATMLLAAVPAIRHVNRLDLARATRLLG